jgi:hypothetical protein
MVIADDNAHPEAGAVAETVVPLRAAPRVDRARAEWAVTELLAALGYPVAGEHRAKTPERVASALAGMLTRAAFLPATFPHDEEYDELGGLPGAVPVAVRAAPAASMQAITTQDAGRGPKVTWHLSSLLDRCYLADLI